MIALLKYTARKLFHLAGMDVQQHRTANSEPAILRRLISTQNISLLLDVGANTGQFVNLARGCGFKGRIVSFEAQTDAHRTLCQRSANGRDWIIAPQAAIGRDEGSIEINIAGNSASSSVLPMLDTHVAAAPGSNYVGKETVRLARLDNVAAPFIRPDDRIYLKVDTQGYEMAVLDGSMGLLNKVLVVQLELSLVPLYAGQPLWVEMSNKLQSLGFELYSIVHGFTDPSSGRLLQVDGIFVRALDNLHPSPPSKDIGVIKRLIF